MDIGTQGCTEECQLLRCQAWILVPSPFVPGVFADWAAVQHVPAAFQCWHGAMLEQMAQTSFVIAQVAERAMVVEIEGIVWYHVDRPFAPRWEKTKEGSTPGVVYCPFTILMV